VLGAIGDYKERTPQIQGLIERYNERKVYPEALFLEWALMVSEDSFKRGVVEELVQGKWPYQMSIMGKEADAIVRRQRTLERYVRDKAEKICEHVMLVRNPPFKATGPAATLLTKLDNVDIGIASRTDENHVYLSLRRHEESDINLASLIDQSASKFGGMGGGHAAAAGGKIPVKRLDEFLLELRRMLPKRRLKRIKELGVASVDKKTIERKLFKETIERRRAEERSYESEEKYRIQFEEALDAIFVADAETGMIIDCNRAASQLVGREKSKIIGQHQRILHPPEEIEGGFSTTFKLHVKEKTGQVLETQVITKKGEKRDVAIKANLFELNSRKMIQAIFRDITEHKRAERKIRSERALYRSIARAANRSRTVEELCELALNGIQKVMVYNESENVLSSVAQVGFPKDLYERTVKWLDLKDGSKIATQAALERKGIYIDDMKTSKLMGRLHDFVVKYDISTMYSVPLFSRGKLQGVLEVITVGDKVLSKEDREVLNTISEELAGGIAKAKSEEHLVTVKEAFGWLAVPTERAPPQGPHP
jgi:PAS domain S-box-containing protein